MSDNPVQPDGPSAFPIQTPAGSVPAPHALPMPPKPDERTLRAVLLDIDGTLVDSNDAHARAWAEAFAEAGKPVDLPAIHQLIGMGSDQMLPAYCGVDSESDEGKQLSKRWEAFFRERYLPHLQAFPQVRPLLETLDARGLILIVATSAKKEMAQNLLQLAQIEDLIDHVVSSEDAANSKPDPDIVHASLDVLDGAHPDEVVLLGDTPYDIASAAKAGVRTIAVRCGGWNNTDLANALAIYQDPADLFTHLDVSPLGHAQPIGA